MDERVTRGVMQGRDPRSIIARLSRHGAAAVEVFSKEGRSVRMRVGRAGERSEAHVHESGVAIRAWSPSGALAFGSFIPDDSDGAEAVIDRIERELSRRAPNESGPPDLPASPPPGVTGLPPTFDL